MKIKLPIAVNHSIEKIKNQDHQADACGKLGLYPVVDSSEWVERLIPYGITTIQLRIKNKSSYILEQEIIRSIALAHKNNIKLFINDYWELAIKHQAYGVHLGQDDLKTADINKIKQTGLRLGISSHNYDELDAAISHKPSYIALGPIYPTTSKIMSCQPQGLDKIYEWLDMITCPLVVIGGINLMNIDEVIATGVSNIAMISAITKAQNPELVCKQLLAKINEANKY